MSRGASNPEINKKNVWKENKEDFAFLMNRIPNL